MKARKWLVPIGGLGAVLAICVLFPDIGWVGVADVEGEFQIVDAASNLPVANAQIRIRDMDLDYGEIDFTLLTNSKGRVRHVWENCRSSGRRSDLFFTDTFSVVTRESLEFRVSAKGYEESDWEQFFFRDAERGEPGKATCVIRVALD